MALMLRTKLLLKDSIGGVVASSLLLLFRESNTNTNPNEEVPEASGQPLPRTRAPVPSDSSAQKFKDSFQKIGRLLTKFCDKEEVKLWYNTNYT
jgi:hypothetical protein